MGVEQTEVLIAGAGPAGLAAAAALRRQGVSRVMVVDREPEAGGIPRLCHHIGFGVYDLRRVYSGPGYARHYARQAEKAGVEIRTATTLTAWEGPRRLAYTSPRGLGVIEAEAVLLATGCRERPRSARLVPGHRPQGVFTTGSLQRFVYEQGLPVGRRAVIVGAELVSLSAVMTLQHARVAPAAMVTELPEHQIYLPYLPAKWWYMDWLARTPLLAGARVTGLLGQKRVEGVEITHVASGATEVLECDTVIFTGGWIPEHELARLGGLALDAGTRGPQVDAALRASTPGVFAAGNLLRGAETADWSALEGGRAARSIAQYLQAGGWPERQVPVEVQAPLEWICPNAVAVNERGPGPARFAFRASAFRGPSRVTVQQDGRLLHTQSFRRLRPNVSMDLAGQWAGEVNPEGGPVRVAVSG